MRLSLPYSGSKRYLNGMDWFVHSFNCMTERSTGVGNLCQVVLELQGSVGSDRVEEALRGFLCKFPVLLGRPSRDLNLAPYWKMPSRRGAVPVPLERREMEQSASLEQVVSWLSQWVNRPFNPPERLRFAHVLVSPDRSYFSMTFDHRLFDARGAEAFLDLFQRSLQDPGIEPDPQDVFPTEPAHLDGWVQRFRSGQQVNRSLIKLSKATPIRLPLPEPLQGRGFLFDVIPLDKAQTQALSESAHREAGYLMLMPYGLAMALKAFHRALAGRRLSGTEYVVPVAIEARAPGQKRQELFFKRVTFLQFKASAQEVEDERRLLSILTQQLYDQMKAALPRHFEEASQLIRIAPVRILARMARAGLSKWVSFSFSFVNESGYASSDFAGVPVANLFHLPRVPVPPALGVFYSAFHGRLNAIVSQLEGVLTEEESQTLLSELRASLDRASSALPGGA